MKSMTWAVTAALALSAVGTAEAYTSKASRTVSVGASGVTGTTTLNMSVVTQGNAADPAATLLYEGNTNAFRDSGESLKIEVDTNVAANRVIIYTNNLVDTANPKACLDTGLGNDGGGLVGTGANCNLTVPMVWGLADTNVNYAFEEVPRTQSNPDAIGATNGVFITDKAHVATFTTVNGPLDNLAMKRCSNNAPVANTAGDGRYPQFFGGPSQDFDLCRQDTGVKIPEAEELSKNIAVVGFGFSGTAGTGPNTSTPIATDTIPLTSPFYLPMGADFRSAAGDVTYASSTLTVELVTQ